MVKPVVLKKRKLKRGDSDGGGGGDLEDESIGRGAAGLKKDLGPNFFEPASGLEDWVFDAAAGF
jgi:hypothetical protein